MLICGGHSQSGWGKGDAQLDKCIKPLVMLIVLTDGKNTEIQYKVLKDVATVAYSDAGSIADIQEKVGCLGVTDYRYA